MSRKPDMPCADCGTLLWRGGTSLPTGSARCRQCRKADWEHGTSKGYRAAACRCEQCRRWNSSTANAYNLSRASDASSHKPCSVAGCERDARAKGQCTLHYRRARRDAGLEQCDNTWTDRKRSNYHARRARANGSRHSDRVLLADLIAAGQTTCRWCAKAIDLTLTYPHKYSKSLDHTLPLSRGGSHTLNNCTLMHLVCNLQKGAQLPEGLTAVHGT